MPKKDIHPKLHKVNVVMTDGTQFEIFTSWGKDGQTLKLDADPKNHPAWQSDSAKNIVMHNERIDKFNKKFGDFFA